MTGMTEGTGMGAAIGRWLRRPDVDDRAERTWTLAGRLREARRGTEAAVHYTPALVVARTRPCPNERDAAETAYWDAVQLLVTEDVWLVARWHQGQVSYLAAPAERFQPDGAPALTPLAQALPGNPLHRGEHGYGTTLDNGTQAVAVAKGGTLQLLLGSPSEVARFAADRGVSVVTADPEAAEEWVPYRLAQLRHRRAITLFAGALGAGTAALASAAWLAAALWHGHQLEEQALVRSQADSYTRNLEEQLADTVRQPLQQHLSRLQSLRDLKAVFGDNAYLLRYEVTKDGSWTWTAVVPDWANDQSLRPFGSGIRLAAASGRPGVLLATGSGR